LHLIWSFTFPEDVWHCWHLAGAAIFVRRKGKYWQSLCRKLQWSEHCGVYSGPVQEDPDTEDNSATAATTAVRNEETATLQMCFPEKPFLLNLGNLRLLPGTETSLTLQLPPAFHLTAGDNPLLTEPEEILFTFTPFILKEAWHGEDTMKGVLCSSLPNIIRPDSDTPAIAGTEPAPGIECTVLIRNRTKAPFELSKVPLYTDTLAVYEINGKFISDKPVIEPHGGDFRETIIKEQGVLLAPPAIKSGVGDTLIRSGTKIIRNITGL